MPAAFDYDPRRPSNRTLLVLGICFVLIAAACAAVAVAKSKGRLTNLVRVSAELVDVGDGLPVRSDVKFRGVLVGSVSDVVGAQVGQPNIVHIDIDPRYAGGIPADVTARVVPSNVFAVSSIQLIDHGTAPRPLRAGDVIAGDTSVPTLMFQSALNKARELFKVVGREPDSDTVGLLTTLGEVTAGRGAELTRTGSSLAEVIDQFDDVVGPGDETSTLAAFGSAVEGLRSTAPDLVDTLSSAITPLQTFAEKRAALDAMLTAGQRTAGTVRGALTGQIDQLVAISTQLTPVLGVLGDRAGDLHTISTKIDRFANRFYDEGWNPETNTLLIKAVVSFTPSRTYIRADCPRYGALEGASCKTAPEVPTAPALLPALASVGVTPPPGLGENRPNLAPPRGSIRGAPPGPPQGPGSEALPPTGATDLEPPLAAEQTGPAAPAGYVDDGAEPSTFGGSVGPIGSDREKAQLSKIVGGGATSADQLLLGPVARGTTVRLSPAEAAP